MRLLVVDDDPGVRDLLVRALERDGHEVSSAACAREARFELSSRPADVMVLDLGLPDENGLELCESLRASGHPVAILMLTAHGEVARRVRALDAGADDFLAKPFALEELRARIRAIARRTLSREQEPRTLRHGDLLLDVVGRMAVRGGTAVALTRREWTILDALAARPRRVVSRGHLLEVGWESDTPASAASLEVLVGRIRRKLGDKLIRTQRGEGYTLEAD
jgi:two-component system, OmpR family, response regulator